MFPRLAVLIAVALTQSRPTGGAIAQFVPPVPTPASFISDQRSVLTPQGHAALDARISEIQRAGRGDIAVAIIPSIGDYSASQVGVEIYRTWKVGAQAEIGSDRRHLGLLILIVPKELSPNNRGECWITTGLGAEALITDAYAGFTCRDSIIPRLRERDFDGALHAGISAIDARLRGLPGVPDPSGSQWSSGPLWKRPGFVIPAGAIGLFAAFGLFLGWWRRRPRTCKKCGSRMVRLDEKSDDAYLQDGQRVEERVKSVDYDVWRCQRGHILVVPWKSWTTGFSQCRECKFVAASSRRRTLSHATTSSSGLAEDTYSCKNCKASWIETVTLPRIDTSSSSGSGGSSGGGGGSSFGGSGSSSGGGGGGSY